MNAEKFMVRLPDGMRERVAQEANDNNRSMNAEIVARLKRTFSKPASCDCRTTEKKDRPESSALIGNIVSMIEFKGEVLLATEWAVFKYDEQCSEFKRLNLQTQAAVN